MDPGSGAGGRRVFKEFCSQIRLSQGDRQAVLGILSHRPLRLDKLIQKIELSDQKEEEPFPAFIKGLAVDARIDLETAKLILDRYQQEEHRKPSNITPLKQDRRL